MCPSEIKTIQCLPGVQDSSLHRYHLFSRSSSCPSAPSNEKPREAERGEKLQESEERLQETEIDPTFSGLNESEELRSFYRALIF